MLIHIDVVKTICYIDGIKGLHTNCRLTTWFVSYVSEHQSDYHGIIWFMFFELLVLCAVNPLLTGGFPYRRSIVWNCVVWLMHFALLAEHWCMIKGFHIPGPVCGVSICSNPPHKRTKAFMSFMFVQTSCSTNSGDASESKTHETQIILFYVTCHLVIDDITVPVCGETTGHQWIPVARGHWSWTLVVQCAAIPPEFPGRVCDALLCVICQSDILHSWTSG